MVRREKITTDTELDIIKHLILSTEFCATIIPTLDVALFSTPHLRNIAMWCMDYYNENEKAPEDVIKQIALVKSAKLPDDRANIIDKVLSAIELDKKDEVAKHFKHHINTAREYFEAQHLKRFTDEINGALASGNLQQAKIIVESFNKIEKIISTGDKPLEDANFIRRMYASQVKSLLQFPDKALSELFQGVYRTEVVSVAAPSKRGKSFFLTELSKICLYNKLNVAFFSFEMDNEQQGFRLFQNLTGETRYSTEEILIPVFDDKGKLTYEVKPKKGMNEESAEKLRDGLHKFGNLGRLFLFDHANGRKMSDIKATIRRIEKYEELKIDVVIIDYDALVESESGFRGQSWEKEAMTWSNAKTMLAQDCDSLVIMASQYGKAGAKNENYLHPTDAQGSSAKFNHVSHWVSLRQTPLEKKAGLMRLSCLGRHGHFHENDHVVVTQCLAIARPIMDARWRHEIPNYEDYLLNFADESDEVAPEETEEPKKKGKKATGLAF